MPKKEDVRRIKKYIDEILNTKSSFTAKIPVRKDKLREYFCNILNEIQFVNSRSIGMKHDFNVDFSEYDEPFYRALDQFFKLHFNEKQRNLINWYLYDKFLPSGDILVLNDNETQKEIPSETPEDIWELVQSLKNNKKFSPK